MSVAALAARIGQTASLRVESGKLALDVRVLDVKLAYGAERYLVTPVAGNGKQWVDGTRLAFPRPN